MLEYPTDQLLGFARGLTAAKNFDGTFALITEFLKRDQQANINDPDSYSLGNLNFTSN